MYQNELKFIRNKKPQMKTVYDNWQSLRKQRFDMSTLPSTRDDLNISKFSNMLT